MSSLPKQASVTNAIEPAAGEVTSKPDMQEYAQLRERYLRTTNALASAAHDLKTPLAILNGYVELLQSEKLGDLNERQREVLALRELLRLSYDQIAYVLAIEPAAVAPLLARARLRLRLRPVLRL